MMKIKRDLINVFYIIIPALICLLIFSLPLNWQEILVLKFDNLNLWSWYTHTFVHQDFAHLTGNIIGYLVGMIATYFILSKKDKDKLPLILLLIIVIVPLILFTSIILARTVGLFPLNLINHRGFSGISSASIGVLTFSLVRRLEIRLKPKGLNEKLALSYFILLPALAFMIYNLSKMLSIIAGGIWIITMINLVVIMRKKSLIDKEIRLKISDFIVLGIGLFILLMEVTTLIPSQISSSTSTTNIFSHFIGYLGGFFITMLIFIKSKSL